MINIQLLQLNLLNPSIIGLSDSDAATVLSVPIYIPRTSPVTITTLSSADSWGFAKTSAAQQAFSQAAASGNAQAVTLLSILTGNGLLASDPQIPALSAGFIALAPNVLTSNDIITALNTTSYKCGDIVQTSDVTTARANIAFNASYNTATTFIQNQVISVNHWLISQQNNNSPVPSNADILAQLGAS